MRRPRLLPLLLLLCALALPGAVFAPAAVARAHHRHHAGGRTATSSTTSSTSSTTATATSAGAGTQSPSALGRAVINDCSNHGQLTRNWSKAALRAAQNEMSADTKQYSNCPSAIQAALLGHIKPGSGGDSGGSSSGGSGSTVLIVVIVVVLVILLVFGGLLLRRRRSGGAPPPVTG